MIYDDLVKEFGFDPLAKAPAERLDTITMLPSVPKPRLVRRHRAK